MISHIRQSASVDTRSRSAMETFAEAAAARVYLSSANGDGVMETEQTAKLGLPSLRLCSPIPA